MADNTNEKLREFLGGKQTPQEESQAIQKKREDIEWMIKQEGLLSKLFVNNANSARKEAERQLQAEKEKLATTQSNLDAQLQALGMSKEEAKNSEKILEKYEERKKKLEEIKDQEEEIREKRGKIRDIESEIREAENTGQKEKAEKLKDNLKKAEEELNTLKEREKTLEKEKEILDEKIDVTKKVLDTEEEENEVLEKQLNARKAANAQIKEGWQSIKSGFSQLKQLTDYWLKADQAASKYSRTVGGGGRALAQMRGNTIRNIQDRGIALKYNVGADELVEMQANLANGIGRAISISNENQEQLAAMSNVLGPEGMQQMLQGLDKFGVSIDKVAKTSGKMYAQASKSGLSMSKYSENMQKSIAIANNYNFRNGVEGMASMAKKATALRLDMEQVSAFASKVNNLEGAMDTAARLQVLGGSFAAMANPLAMLNESMNDIEGLQDRMVKSFAGMGTFDKATGTVKITGGNRLKIREAAKAMGVSPEAMMDMINMQGKRAEINRQTRGIGMSDDLRELFTNLAQFDENGNARVTVNSGGYSGEYTAQQIAQDVKLQEELKKLNQSESEDIKDIAQNTRSVVDLIEGGKKQIGNTIGEQINNLVESIFPEGNIMKSINGTIDKMTKWANTKFGSIIALLGIIAASGGISVAKGLYNVGAGVKGNIANGGLAKFIGKTAGTSAAGATTAGGATTAAGGATTAVGASTAGGATTAAGAGGLSTLGSLGIGAGLTIAGTVGNHFIGKGLESGKIKQGSFGHYGGRAASTAMQGAGIGIMLSPLVGALGASAAVPFLAPVAAVAGAAIGIAKAAKEMNVATVKAKTGIENYSGTRANAVKNALETGQLSTSARRALERNGDTEILTKIDAKKAERGIKGDYTKAEMAKINNAIAKGKLNKLDKKLAAKVVSQGDMENFSIQAGKVAESMNPQKVADNAIENAKKEVEVKFVNKLDIACKLDLPNGRSLDISELLIKNDALLEALVKAITPKITDEQLRLATGGKVFGGSK